MPVMKTRISALVLSLACIAVSACTPIVKPLEQQRDVPLSEQKGEIVNGYRFYEDGVLTDGEKKVLFFHAAWCPLCIEKDENLRQWYSSEQVPLPVYRIDFDTADALKKQYRVSYQDTFVLVDGNGTALQTLVLPKLSELKRVLYENTEQAQ